MPDFDLGPNISGPVSERERSLVALAVMAERKTWSPIDTAPTDGTPVLLYAAERDGLPAFQCVASYHPDAGWCVCELRYATHWMPLPSPPTDQP